MFSFRSVLVYLYWHLLRPFIKWFLRKTTKQCELQRICYGIPSGYLRSKGVEDSLNNSKTVVVKTVISELNKAAESQQLYGEKLKLSLEYCVGHVIRVKNIKPSVHRQFIKSFSRCVEHIWGYKQLFFLIESLRLTNFDVENVEHELKLLNLWNALKPGCKLESRVTKQWQEIGFQGDDPKTDFRGMGLLGLENLLFFAQEYSQAAQHVLSHSLHPQYGYAFAIVGINITSMAYHLFKDSTAKTHVFNTCKGAPTLRVFHQFYCFLFYEFDKFWIESKPRDVMEFPYVRDRFEKNIRKQLANPETSFKINFVVNTV